MESANKGSETSAGEQFPPDEKQDHNQSVQLTTREASTVRAPKSGGPKTPEGKQKSSQNSLKHGIFSQVALLKGESRAKFNSLLSGLRNDRRPVGTLEEVHVDKLAVLMWRQRRLILVLNEGPLSGRGFDILSFNIGEPQLFDLFLRYEASLERAIDRTLSQLERLQRMRKGQPVPPTLNVNVST